MSKQDIELFNLRKNYSKKSLNLEDVHSNPLDQFKEWLQEAMVSRVNEPNAMIFSSVNKQGKPSSRTVLLKKIFRGNFVFFTNYNSRKADELKDNSSCALLFLWHELERQVRIQGDAYFLPAEESDEYFSSRPRASQIGAWASPQSSEIKNREVLEHKAQEMEKRFADKPLERPEFWGGYYVVPRMMEFWQGRPERLHDRIQYSRGESQWKIVRLAP